MWCFECCSEQCLIAILLNLYKSVSCVSYGHVVWNSCEGHSWSVQSINTLLILCCYFQPLVKNPAGTVVVIWVPLLQHLINNIINKIVMLEVRLMYCYSLHKYTVFILCCILTFVQWGRVSWRHDSVPMLHMNSCHLSSIIAALKK
jgi:hypothetical protein